MVTRSVDLGTLIQLMGLKNAGYDNYLVGAKGRLIATTAPLQLYANGGRYSDLLATWENSRNCR